MPVHNSDQFNLVKAGFISVIKKRLRFLKVRENKLNQPISGLDIEYKLRFIARKCHTRNKKLFYGIATYVEHNFEKKQRKILYELLNEIEEDIRWLGINTDFMLHLDWKEFTRLAMK